MLNANAPKKIKVVYEDSYLLIVNKPAGVIVLRTLKSRDQTVQSYLEEKLGIFLFGRAGIVHRLDKETAGLLLVAKTEEIFKNLQLQFRERRVLKTYWALVEGFLKGEGVVIAPLKRTKDLFFKFEVFPGGRKAETSFKVLKNLNIKGKECSLLEVKPRTGRTHQIRVHLRYLGHPIYGDPVYGGELRKEKPMFLFAKEIVFFHPGFNKKFSFSLELPQKWQKILKEGEKK